MFLITKDFDRAAILDLSHIVPIIEYDANNIKATQFRKFTQIRTVISFARPRARVPSELSGPRHIFGMRLAQKILVAFLFSPNIWPGLSPANMGVNNYDK